MEGFGVFAAFAGCSSGAFSTIDQTIRMAVHRISAISSVYTRSGQTQTRSSSSFSIGGLPSRRRRSFRTAWRMEYHVKKISRKISAEIGTLSGLPTMRRKFSSVSPEEEKDRQEPEHREADLVGRQGLTFPDQ